jgi:predicted HAD superfamily phosphohydrolase YqeG
MTNNSIKKYLLLDLDGTLIETADKSFKAMKDGQVETDLSMIRIFDQTIDFLSQAKELGFECIIISDSHPKYVKSILKVFFADYCSDALSLADKPNTLKTLTFLNNKGINISQENCYIIGDSWLDIELGRGLSIPTILTNLYKATNLELRDGIGDYSKNIKSGSTYYVKSYSEILDILKNPLQKLLCLEAKFKNITSYTSRKTQLDSIEENNKTFHRVLARQCQGECDKYHVTEKYFEFSRVDRSTQLLHDIRDAVVTYIKHVLDHKSYSWDIFTHIPDKSTTQPPNKMKELFHLIVEQIYQKGHRIDCFDVFEWNKQVNSSTRKQPTADERRNFLNANLKLCDIVNVTDKSVIVIDDQYTTGATADAITNQLRKKGARNVLFIGLFHLVTPVNSSKLCPQCLAKGINKQLQIKINRTTGEKFYSCVLPKYGGNGCDYTENI